MTKREREALINFATELRRGQIGGANQDLLARRKGQCIIFEPMFDEDIAKRAEKQAYEIK